MFTTYFRPALMLLILLTLLTGIAYPLLSTGLSLMLFPQQAKGSLLWHDNTLVGSRLIGQSFTQPGYFWGRPSATSDSAYNAMASGGSNLAISNPALDQAISQHASTLLSANPQMTTPIPVDLLTASGSGLDPHISIDAAHWQAARVARARGLSLEQLDQLVDAATTTPWPTFIGQPVVNVLQLNQALDVLSRH
jgi:K+-transporting ATPase ATPase C chain